MATPAEILAHVSLRRRGLSGSLDLTTAEELAAGVIGAHNVLETRARNRREAEKSQRNHVGEDMDIELEEI